MCIRDRCHINSKPMCKHKKFSEMGEAYYKAYIAHTKATRYAQLVDNTHCVKDVINNEYWEAERLSEKELFGDDFKLYIYVMSGVILILTIAAVIAIFICGRKKDPEDKNLMYTEVDSSYNKKSLGSSSKIE
eukprot:TRINITY_DN9647_c0_g1_i2.p1 TRINITY_DN9647_c0_g1~~TRINITY_DN9647_c0_g1_i2.p1  ORF type:complete len:132 (-),score=33.92 TRINITY_DN9647_c0_g1_i2:148-543(-)